MSPRDAARGQAVDTIDTAVRCFVLPAPAPIMGDAEPTDPRNKSGGASCAKRSAKEDPRSQWARALSPAGHGRVMTFDCETTVAADAAGRIGQRAILVAWQVNGCFDSELAKTPPDRHALATIDRLRERGIAYDPDWYTTDKIALIKAYCERHGLKCCTVAEWREHVFLREAWRYRSLCLGFNLPFDLGAIAVDWGGARGPVYRGGFSLGLGSRWFPRVRVKKMSKHAHLIGFSKVKGRKADEYLYDGHRGSFLDVRTAALALRDGSGSLRALGLAYADVGRALFDDYVIKEEWPGEHGGAITDAYLDYAVRDVQATHSLYRAVRAEYQRHGVHAARPLTRLFSAASLGKAVLKAVGVPEFVLKGRSDTRLLSEDEKVALEDDLSHSADFDPPKSGTRFPRFDFDPRYLGYAMQTFFGARVDVAVRRTIVECMVCDVTSQYPLINALLGVQDFLLARAITVRHDASVRADVDRLLAELSLNRDRLRDPTFWARLRYFVKIVPTGDLLPVRAQFEGADWNIGLATVAASPARWYAIQDVIASMLLTGHAPTIVDAFEFLPSAEKLTTKPYAVMGDAAVTIDLNTQNLFVELIKQRARVRREMKAVPENGERWRQLDAVQKTLKLLANSTSYGIFVEVNETKHARKVSAVRYGGGDEPSRIETDVTDEPGPYFMAGVGSLITASGRLLLALCEVLSLDRGLGYVACDTDAMIFGRPDTVECCALRRRVENICAWFQPLSPFGDGIELFKIEDENHQPDTKDYQPLYCQAISSKRYMLFNIADDGSPVLRKASAHGLPPYILPPEFTPRAPKDWWKTRVRAAWQHDVMEHAAREALAGRPPRIDPRVAALPVMTQTTVSTWNVGLQVGDAARAFGFFMTAPALTKENASVLRVTKDYRFPDAPDADQARLFEDMIASGQGFYAPLEKSWGEARLRTIAGHHRITFPEEYATTIGDRLDHYFDRREKKMANGGDSGVLRRRRVIVDGSRLIGKETHRVNDELVADTDGVMGREDHALTDHGTDDADADAGGLSVERLIEWTKTVRGIKATAKALGLARSTLRKILNGERAAKPKEVARWREDHRKHSARTTGLVLPREVFTRQYQDLCEEVEDLEELAREAGLSAAVLDELLAGRYLPSNAVVKRIAAAVDRLRPGCPPPAVTVTDRETGVTTVIGYHHRNTELDNPE